MILKHFIDILIFQHEKKYEIFMNRAKEIDIDERVGCLLQVGCKV